MIGKKVLLAVLAHPDDETFGVGGTLAYYAKHGVDVYLICATRGEAGMVEEQYLHGFASIAELRESELRCAADKLGLQDVIFLNYRDSGMPGSLDNQHPQALVNAPETDLVQKIVESIRTLQPQVVITFDPIGGYGHPDHICIHQAARKAFYEAGKEEYACKDLAPYRPQKLYFYTISKTIMRWMVKLMPFIGKDPRRYGQNGDIDLRSISEKVYPVNARIEYGEVAKNRLEASYCYASQGGKKPNKDAAGLLRGWASTSEIFIREYPEPVPGYIEKDLFENALSN